MPVIVIGADTEHGRAIAGALGGRQGEVRAFVTDPDTAQTLRALGVKVAIGDVSDASHIEGAAYGAFSAVLVADAGLDDRERSFAPSYDALLKAWAEGLRDAGISRIIWVGPDEEAPRALAASGVPCPTVDTRKRSAAEVAVETVRLDDLSEIEPS